MKVLARIGDRLFPEDRMNPVVRRLYYGLRCLAFNIRRRKSGDKVSYDGASFAFSLRGVCFRSYDNIFTQVRHIGEYCAKQDIEEGFVVVDAGAYVGVFSMYASRKVGQRGRVIAFEPDPRNYRRLVANIKLNGMKNVVCVPKGLWSDDGSIRCFVTGNQVSSFIEGQSSVNTPV